MSTMPRWLVYFPFCFFSLHQLLEALTELSQPRPTMHRSASTCSSRTRAPALLVEIKKYVRAPALLVEINKICLQSVVVLVSPFSQPRLMPMRSHSRHRLGYLARHGRVLLHREGHVSIGEAGLPSAIGDKQASASMLSCLAGQPAAPFPLILLPSMMVPSISHSQCYGPRVPHETGSRPSMLAPSPRGHYVAPTISLARGPSRRKDPEDLTIKTKRPGSRRTLRTTYVG